MEGHPTRRKYQESVEWRGETLQGPANKKQKVFLNPVVKYLRFRKDR